MTWKTAEAMRRRGVSVVVGCAKVTTTLASDVDVVTVPQGPDPLLRGCLPGVRSRWTSWRHHPFYLLRGVQTLRLAGVQAIEVTHEFANLLPARVLAKSVALITLLHAVWVDDYPKLAKGLMHADAVATVSEFVRDAVLTADPRLEGKTFTVRNGVDLAAFPGRAAARADEPEAVDAWRTRLDAHDRPLIVAVGRIAPEKGQHVLAAAASLLADRGERPVVAMVGQAGAYERPGRAQSPVWREIEALVPRYAERVVAAGARADVRLLGHLPGADVRRLLAAADVFVSPSLCPEPFGLPVLEALAMDLPVVATAGGATPELVGDAGVLVPPADHAALADVLGQLLASPSERDRLAHRARAQASRHSWDATAAQLEALVRKIV